jgi:hypothetical protein
VPCKTCNTLIERHEIAATHLHRATIRLASLAGKNQPALFFAAKQNCAAYREECIRSRTELHVHQKTHTYTLSVKTAFGSGHKGRCIPTRTSYRWSFKLAPGIADRQN